MNNFKIYTFLAFFFLGNTSLSAQSMLDLYFGGNRDSLTTEATKLIHTPEPTFKPSNQQTEQDPAFIADMGFEQVYKVENRFFTVRDEKRIFAYRFAKKSDNTIILIHGVGSNAYMYNKTAGLLQEATQGEVYAIDLRGHGQSEGKSGDVDYINQYVDDLADIIETIRKEKPNGKIIITGHSMGGGVALRYAMANQYEQPDDYVTGLKAVNKPMLVLMGSEDEAFSSEATKEAILKNSDGEFQIIDKASHNGVRHNAQSFILIKDWFSKL